MMLVKCEPIRHDERRLSGNVAAMSGLLAFVGACTTQPEARYVQTPRAIWVTRWDYRTANDVKQIMANCKSLGLNTVLFQVRGNGTVFYRSSIEPWAEEFGYKDPGFDPLALAIAEAHRRDMQLHAWVNVMPAWRGCQPPKYPRHLYHTRPEWFLSDQRGRRQPPAGHYMILNPCLPDVRRYLVGVFRELCTNYELDGLHMDYIRFVRQGSERQADYPHDKRTLYRFRRATGKTPSADRQAWNDWRRAAITQVVADIHRMVRRVRPTAKLSAAVLGDRVAARNGLFQDGERWLAEGLIDAAYPMIYDESIGHFASVTEDWRAHSHGRPVVPGLGVSSHERDANSIRQLRMAWAWGDGFSLFAYNSFFATPREQGAAASAVRRRQLRLKHLRPVLRALAAESRRAVRLAAASPGVGLY